VCVRERESPSNVIRTVTITDCAVHCTARKFDNFQFVPFNETMKKVPPGQNPDPMFAMAALMEVPEQFKLIRKLRLL